MVSYRKNFKDEVFKTYRYNTLYHPKHKTGEQKYLYDCKTSYFTSSSKILIQVYYERLHMNSIISRMAIKNIMQRYSQKVNKKLK